MIVPLPMIMDVMLVLMHSANSAVSKVSLEPAEFVRQAKHILKKVVSENNFEAGFDFIERVAEMGEAFNRATSIMLTGMDKAWKPADHEGETFLQKTYRRLGLSPETIVRHTRNQNLTSQIPGEFREAIELSPENCRIQIANLLEDGYEIAHKDWQALSEVAGDRRMVGKIARSIKGVAPRTNWSMFTVDENGIIVKHTKDQHEVVGELYVFEESKFVLDGIESIKRRADIKPSIKY